jgi:hypothetical protein
MAAGGVPKEGDADAKEADAEDAEKGEGGACDTKARKAETASVSFAASAAVRLAGKSSTTGGPKTSNNRHKHRNGAAAEKKGFGPRILQRRSPQREGRWHTTGEEPRATIRALLPLPHQCRLQDGR